MPGGGGAVENADCSTHTHTHTRTWMFLFQDEFLVLAKGRD